MKTKHMALLDFQKKLILSTNQQTRIDALSIYRIVAQNLKEFIELRIPEENYDDILENMNAVAEVYHMWAISIIRRFPALTNFKPLVYVGKPYVAQYVTDGLDPTQFIGDSKTEDSDEFAAEVDAICTSAGTFPGVITVVHCWNDVAATTDHYKDSDAFGEDVMVSSQLYHDETKAVFVFYWRYNFLINFADKRIFEELLGYLDAETYDASKVRRKIYIKDAHKSCMMLPTRVFADPMNQDILCRTPFYIGTSGHYTCITPIQALARRVNFDDVDEVWMTLYRTDHEEGGEKLDAYRGFIKAMASRLQSKFHIYVELCARGDTRNNLALYRELKEAGADVQCRPCKELMNQKVHAKVIVVRAKNSDPEASKGKAYWKWVRMVSTGNFVTAAAEQFRDTFFISTRYTEKEYYGIFSVFPSCASMFHNLQLKVMEDDNGESVKYHLQEPDFIGSSEGIRTTLEDMIEAAIDITTNHPYRPFIWIKVNNITEPRIINRILDAVRAGVQVHIITRSGCCIPTEISYPNLRIKSISGRYLEHDRFIIFGYYYGRSQNGALLEGPELCSRVVHSAYIMSADLMQRNLYNRIEFMCKMPDEYEAEALADLYQNIFNCESEPESGFFNFSLTPSCWNLSGYDLAELMPLRCDGGSISYGTDGPALEETQLDGDLEFEKALVELLRTYGQEFNGHNVSKVLKALREPEEMEELEEPSDDIDMEAWDEEEQDALKREWMEGIAMIAQRYQDHIQSMRQEQGCEEAEVTILSPEEMSIAVDRAARERASADETEPDIIPNASGVMRRLGFDVP